ncbi:MAG: hypothetical protein ABH865_07815 [Candidatus Omnitrophota bacterium]|nr:class I SAM-dependent methyltransferase [Candidatus Omnitrophota bacterium]
MFLEEALWIANFLATLRVYRGQALIDVGSSDERLRCLALPFVDYYIFRPLRESGVTIIYIDQREGKGVSIVCDMTSESVEVLKNITPAEVVLCTSFLEHVANRDRVVQRIKELTRSGGYIIITVPYVYKYHPDPIDTLYRPSNKDLEALFTRDEYTVVESMTIEVEGEPVIVTRRLSIRIIHKITRTFFPRLALKLASYFAPIIIKNKVSILAVQKK